jgi:hypothetical protein
MYRTGDVARALGISSATLRLWERQGLIQPSRTRGTASTCARSSISAPGRAPSCSGSSPMAGHPALPPTAPAPRLASATAWHCPPGEAAGYRGQGRVDPPHKTMHACLSGPVFGARRSPVSKPPPTRAATATGGPGPTSPCLPDQTGCEAPRSGRSVPTGSDGLQPITIVNGRAEHTGRRGGLQWDCGGRRPIMKNPAQSPTVPSCFWSASEQAGADTNRLRPVSECQGWGTARNVSGRRCRGSIRDGVRLPRQCP